MSRTVRTMPWRLGVREGGSVSLALYDLRYDRAETARAVREGRRPVPVKALRRTTCSWWVGLECRGGWFASEVAAVEGRARMRSRVEAERIRGLHRAGYGVDDADIAPVRHRHGALWDAW